MDAAFAMLAYGKCKVPAAKAKFATLIVERCCAVPGKRNDPDFSATRIREELREYAVL